jgi:hypothetical protein
MSEYVNLQTLPRHLQPLQLHLERARQALRRSTT